MRSGSVKRGGRQVKNTSDGSVHHERAVVTDWSRADGIGSARTVETRRDVFIALFTMPVAVANTLSVGSEIALDYEWAEGGQDGLERRDCGDTQLWIVVLASARQRS